MRLVNAWKPFFVVPLSVWKLLKPSWRVNFADRDSFLNCKMAVKQTSSMWRNPLRAASQQLREVKQNGAGTGQTFIFINVPHPPPGGICHNSESTFDINPISLYFYYYLLVKGRHIMQITEADIRQKTWKSLLNCTRDISFLKEPPTPIELAEDDVGPDLAARITLPQGDQVILFECKNVGQPRVARNAVNQILRYLERWPTTTASLWHLTYRPGLRKFAREME